MEFHRAARQVAADLAARAVARLRAQPFLHGLATDPDAVGFSRRLAKGGVVGAYIDDATSTTQIKSRFVASKAVDAASIYVETLKGTVLLSGFAKNPEERSAAERIARDVNGVKVVRNEIIVRP